MIRSVRSNNPDFKTVEFHPGFNVVLADRNVEIRLKESTPEMEQESLL